MDVDWDLNAVVRGCSSTTAAASTSSTTTAASTSSTTTATVTNTTTTNSQLFSNFNQNQNFFSTSPFQDLFQPTTTQRNPINEELHDLYKPFFPKLPESSQVLLPPHRLPIPPLSVQDLSSEQQITKQLPQKQHLFSVGNGSKSTVSSRSKKRKNNLKKVCHVAAENLSCDMWSWRKYGQKPIKGSPYPRGYYKCSTLKGCMARKQVERNKSDPGMFIVTYTAEHNHPMPTHRSSLAGSTRHKPEDNPNSDDLKKPSCSSEMSPETNFSPAPEKLESSRDDVAEAEDEDDDFSVSDMAVEDDFFAGLEDFTGQDGGECDSDQFPAKLEFPWVVDNATAAAAGGG